MCGKSCKYTLFRIKLNCIEKKIAILFNKTGKTGINTLNNSKYLFTSETK
jgi:hypothetical protein